MYKNDNMMDCGYFLGGDPRGLLYVPSNGEAVIIPWSELLPEEETNQPLEQDHVS